VCGPPSFVSRLTHRGTLFAPPPPPPPRVPVYCKGDTERATSLRSPTPGDARTCPPPFPQRGTQMYRSFFAPPLPRGRVDKVPPPVFHKEDTRMRYVLFSPPAPHLRADKVTRPPPTFVGERDTQPRDSGTAHSLFWYPRFVPERGTQTGAGNGNPPLSIPLGAKGALSPRDKAHPSWRPPFTRDGACAEWGVHRKGYTTTSTLRSSLRVSGVHERGAAQRYALVFSLGHENGRPGDRRHATLPFCCPAPVYPRAAQERRAPPLRAKV
jgi:hypothetical protein